MVIHTIILTLSRMGKNSHFGNEVNYEEFPYLFCFVHSVLLRQNIVLFIFVLA